MATSPPSTAPAPPRLASAVLQQRQERQTHGEVQPELLRTGCRVLDEEALQGGFRYGEITGLAAGQGKELEGAGRVS